jgi:hypothetical protein
MLHLRAPARGGFVVARSGPPAYAWDWFARQRLLWREVRTRLAGAAAPVAVRYAAVETRTDVVPMLRSDYPRDPLVRETVDRVVAELAFLGRTDVPFAALGATNAPRGMRWWWSALTGEDLDGGSARTREPELEPEPPLQLALEDVHEGYGG